MLNYHIEKGTLPVLPGDYVYCIGTDHACTVRAIKVDAVILGKNDQITAKVNNEYGESEFGKHIFLTAEEAEEVAAKERPTPPYFFSDRAVQWMPVETWEPLNDTYYGVMVAQDDGSYKHQIAYFDSGEKYEDEKGFYQSDRRSAPRIENVVAWIDPDYIDSDEWYEGKPRDFSYSPIEELDIQVRTYNVLKENGIHVIRDILRLPDKASLLKIKNMGRKSYEDIIAQLETAGFEVDYLK